MVSLSYDDSVSILVGWCHYECRIVTPSCFKKETKAEKGKCEHKQLIYG